DSLLVISFCLNFADRVAIPAPSRQNVSQSFHSGQPGVGRMKATVRIYVHWPGIDNQREVLARQHNRCLQGIRPQAWKQPELPLSRLYVEFVVPVVRMVYMNLKAAYPGWPDIVPLTNVETSTTTNFSGEVSYRNDSRRRPSRIHDHVSPRSSENSSVVRKTSDICTNRHTIYTVEVLR
ncbi:uncharacterized protein DEA37_0009250, partial [Paragonimus westermani]